MEALADRGNKIIVLMNSFYDYKPKYFDIIKLPIKYVRHRFPPASYLFKKNVKKNIIIIQKQIRDYNCENIDFIHIHGDMHLKTAVFLKTKLRTRLFYASRCNDIDRARIIRRSGALTKTQYLFSLIYEPINRYREKQIACYADVITHQNRLDAGAFIARTGVFRPLFRRHLESKTVIIPGNIGPPRCNLEWQNKNNSREIENIVYVGSLCATKGLWDLLKAFGKLKKNEYTFLSCKVLGRKEDVECTLHLIQKLNIEEMISIEGFKDPFPYLAECDLMVYPTLYDAYPDTILEALHVGCPVIAASVGGIPDLLKYPELLFESGRPGEIAGKIERCVDDNNFYQKIRLLCAERAEAHRFEWAEQFETAMRNYYS
jgi:glycosyltransferase involved in cell wall biosynthesis